MSVLQCLFHLCFPFQKYYKAWIHLQWFNQLLCREKFFRYTRQTEMEYLHESPCFIFFHRSLFNICLGISLQENKYLCFTETSWTALLCFWVIKTLNIFRQTLFNFETHVDSQRKAICMFLINLHLTHQNVVF